MKRWREVKARRDAAKLSKEKTAKTSHDESAMDPTAIRWKLGGSIVAVGDVILEILHTSTTRGRIERVPIDEVSAIVANKIGGPAGWQWGIRLQLHNGKQVLVAYQLKQDVAQHKARELSQLSGLTQPNPMHPPWRDPGGPPPAPLPRESPHPGPQDSTGEIPVEDWRNQPPIGQ